MSMQIFPMIPSKVILPFAEAIRQSGGETSIVLRAAKLPLSIIGNETTAISVQSFYRFVNQGALLLNDRHFGFRVGYQSPIVKLPIIPPPMQARRSLGNLLTRLIQDAEKTANHISYRIDIRSEWTSFIQKRQFKPAEIPAQIDAFGLGIMGRFFDFALGEHWDKRKLRVTISDPSCVPAHFLESSSLNCSDWQGATYSFPTSWLHDYTVANEAKCLDGDNFIEAIHYLLRMQIDNPEFSCDMLANLIGISSRTIRRKLAANNTSFHQVLSASRKQKAEKALTTTNKSVQNIGASVGYKYQGNFNKAFKSWTGMTPSAYRNSRK